MIIMMLWPPAPPPAPPPTTCSPAWWRWSPTLWAAGGAPVTTSRDHTWPVTHHTIIVFSFPTKDHAWWQSWCPGRVWLFHPGPQTDHPSRRSWTADSRCSMTVSYSGEEMKKVHLETAVVVHVDRRPRTVAASCCIVSYTPLRSGNLISDNPLYLYDS